MVEYNRRMEKLAKQFGIVPYLLVGFGLFIVGSLAINQIVDNFWPINVERLDLIRATALGQADSTVLLRESNPEIILTFLATVMVAVTGLVMPLAYFLNKRFGQESSLRFVVVLRRAMWVGIWFAFCTWLQMNRSLNVGVALLVAAVFIVVEVLLQVRTKANLITGID